MLPVQLYRDCYGECRGQGGGVQMCMESCQALMPGDTTVPVYAGDGAYDPSRRCEGFWSCFASDLPGTVSDVAGGVWTYTERAAGAAAGLLGGVAWPVATMLGAAVLVYLLVRR